MNASKDKEIHYRLMKIISQESDLTQREIAEKMGVSLGKVNYGISELGKKGFIKIKRFKVSKSKIRYLYLMTPKGIEEKTKLTLSFLRLKMLEYEEIKKQINELVSEVENGSPEQSITIDLSETLD